MPLSSDKKRQFAECLSAAMSQINESSENGPLVYFNKYIDRKMEEAGQQLVFGEVNPEALAIAGKALVDLGEEFRIFLPSKIDTKQFEILLDEDGDPRAYCYRLKENISASDAIEHLVNEGLTFIECNTAVVLAYYLALLAFLKINRGDAKGKAYFDVLFGSSIEATPQNRRLLIRPFLASEVSARRLLYNDINLMAYFLGNLSREDHHDAYTQGERGLPSGAMCGFQNAKDYQKWHSTIGSSNALNVVQTAVTDDGSECFQGFGCGGSESRESILQQLTEAINRPPSQLILYLFMMSGEETRKTYQAALWQHLRDKGLANKDCIPKFRAAIDNLEKRNKEYSTEDMLGLRCVRVPNEDHLAELLELDDKMMSENLDRFSKKERSRQFVMAEGFANGKQSRFFAEQPQSFAARFKKMKTFELFKTDPKVRGLLRERMRKEISPAQLDSRLTTFLDAYDKLCRSVPR